MSEIFDLNEAMIVSEFIEPVSHFAGLVCNALEANPITACVSVPGSGGKSPILCNVRAGKERDLTTPKGTQAAFFLDVIECVLNEYPNGEWTPDQSRRLLDTIEAITLSVVEKNQKTEFWSAIFRDFKIVGSWTDEPDFLTLDGLVFRVKILPLLFEAP